MSPAGEGGGDPAARLRAFWGDAPPARLGVAVSGGSDSLALLHLLHDWGRTGLAAATLDHGLRPGSAAEAAGVGRLCAGLGIPHAVLTWDGAAAAGNLPAAARAARYRLLADWAAQAGLDAVALGHTRDDNVESFVMGLARGAGLDGLSGMRRRFRHGGVAFLRPLLGIGREELRALLRARGIGWLDDPTNEDTRHARPRIRQALARAGVEPGALARSVANLAGARAGMEAALADWIVRHVRLDRGDLAADPEALAALPPEFARRYVAAALRWVAGADYPPRAGPVLRLLACGPGRGATLHGCLVGIEPRGLVIGREGRAAAAAPDMPCGGTWDGRWRLAGPGAPDLRLRALGADGLAQLPDRRAAGLPRARLLPHPALFRGDRLVAAPLSGLPAGFRVVAPDLSHFVASVIAH